jgi:hypothetical protein
MQSTIHTHIGTRYTPLTGYNVGHFICNLQTINRYPMMQIVLTWSDRKTSDKDDVSDKDNVIAHHTACTYRLNEDTNS